MSIYSECLDCLKIWFFSLFQNYLGCFVNKMNSQNNFFYTYFLNEDTNLFIEDALDFSTKFTLSSQILTQADSMITSKKKFYSYLYGLTFVYGNEVNNLDSPREAISCQIYDVKDA